MGLHSVEAKFLNIKRFETPLNSQVYYVKQSAVPMVDIAIAFPAGSAFDEQHPGLAALTSQMIDKGTSKYSAQQLAEKFADLGAIVNTQVTKEMATISLRTLSSQSVLNDSLNLVSHMMKNIQFPQQELQQQIENLSHQWLMAQQSPDEVANQLFFQTLYKGHPYAHSVLGSPASLKKLDRNMVTAFYRRHYAVNHAIIAIVGDVSATQASAIARQLSQSLPAAGKIEKITPATPHRKSQTVHQTLKSNQTAIRIGQLGITHHNPNYFALLVGNYTLGGGGLVSRLSEAVREKRGLTYGIYSQFKAMPAIGPFVIQFATQSTQANTALEVVKATLLSFLKTGPDTQELKQAKQFLNGYFPIQLSSNSKILATLINLGFYHLPKDYLDTYLDKINAVSEKQIKLAFNKVLNPKTLTTITVGPQK